MLLRVGWTNASWDHADAQSFARSELRDGKNGIDQNISVYEVEKTDIVRAVAEHCAGFDLQPKPKLRHLDLDGIGGTVKRSRGGCPFEFTATQHREVVLRDEEVGEFCDKLFAERFARMTEVSFAQLGEYASARIELGDPEWKSFFATTKHRTKWEKNFPKKDVPAV